MRTIYILHENMEISVWSGPLGGVRKMKMPENRKFDIFYPFQTIFSTIQSDGPLRGVAHIEKFHCIR